MTQTISRIKSNGVFEISGEFDEISRANISYSPNSVYAKEFDEVTLNPITNGLAKRETMDGKFLVAGYFDEQTHSLNAP